jgi:hypothetical protein
MNRRRQIFVIELASNLQVFLTPGAHGCQRQATGRDWLVAGFIGGDDRHHCLCLIFFVPWNI